MIWQCADCGNQVVFERRPASCRFCGPDVEFFVQEARELRRTPRLGAHPGGWSRRAQVSEVRPSK